MRQFWGFKEKYAEAVLFFRMGDSYETLFEDGNTCWNYAEKAESSRRG